MRKHTPLLFSISLLTGCGDGVPVTDYPGIYLLNRGDTKEILEVIADGRYKHRREWLGKTDFFREGYWDKDVAGGNAGITFKSFNKGYWFVVPERSWTGKILLCVDVDGELCFEKTR